MRALLIAFAAVQLLLGLLLWLTPGFFYDEIGPFGARNDHYMADVATFYIALGTVAFMSVRRPSWRVPVLTLALFQYALHALNHLIDIGESDPGWIGPADFVSLTLVAVLLAPGPGAQRSIEYDTVSDRYVNFVETEVLPCITRDYQVAFTKDPDGRATMGQSSGAAAALTMAWLHPNLYRRVISISGTFVALQRNATAPNGAWDYHQTFIPGSDRKPLRLWLHVSENDLGANTPAEQKRNWVIANNRMAEVLEAKRYPGADLGTIVGKAGLERHYDDTLRGIEGVRYMEVNARGRLVREDAGGASLQPTPGRPIHTTIDLELQRYIDSIWPAGMRGAMIAMTPGGAIRALYSAPTYDPNAFIGGISSKLWKALNEDEARPLLNRAIQTRYPPASPFKLAIGAMALKRGLIRLDTHMPTPCRGGMRLGNRVFRCWKKEGHGSLDLVGAVAASCDVYFYQVGLRLGLNAIIEDGVLMGFRDKSGIAIALEGVLLLAMRRRATSGMASAGRLAKARRNAPSWPGPKMVPGRQSRLWRSARRRASAGAGSPSKGWRTQAKKAPALISRYSSVLAAKAARSAARRSSIMRRFSSRQSASAGRTSMLSTPTSSARRRKVSTGFSGDHAERGSPRAFSPKVAAYSAST